MMATGGTILQVHAIAIQLIMKIFDSFGMKDMIIVPTARHSINLVPKHSAVQGRRSVLAPCVPEARYRYIESVVIEL